MPSSMMEKMFWFPLNGPQVSLGLKLQADTQVQGRRGVNCGTCNIDNTLPETRCFGDLRTRCILQECQELDMSWRPRTGQALNQHVHSYLAMTNPIGSRMRKRVSNMRNTNRKLVRAALKLPLLSGTRLQVRLYYKQPQTQTQQGNRMTS